MVNKTRTTKLSGSGSELVHQQHETDSPILPVAQMEKLQTVKPAAIDFILEQTEKEADHRREQTDKNNRRVFITRTIGQFCALIVSVVGVSAGCYIAYVNPDEPTAGASIAIASIAGLAIAFIGGRHSGGQ